MMRYLCFSVAELALAIRLDQVGEVVQVPPITKIPRPARHIEGLANLRGKTIPVVDLRKRLGLVNPEMTSHARMIVAIPGGSHEPLGFIVDLVGEILSVGAVDGPGPGLAPCVDSRIVAGVFEVEGRAIHLADLGKIME